PGSRARDLSATAPAATRDAGDAAALGARRADHRVLPGARALVPRPPGARAGAARPPPRRLALQRTRPGDAGRGDRQRRPDVPLRGPVHAHVAEREGQRDAAVHPRARSMDERAPREDLAGRAVRSGAVALTRLLARHRGRPTADPAWELRVRAGVLQDARARVVHGGGHGRRHPRLPHRRLSRTALEAVELARPAQAEDLRRPSRRAAPVANPLPGGATLTSRCVSFSPPPWRRSWGQPRQRR